MFIHQQQDWTELNLSFQLAVVCDVLYTCFGRSENFTDDGLFFACGI
jgi:hypothetical protein